LQLSSTLVSFFASLIVYDPPLSCSPGPDKGGDYVETILMTDPQDDGAEARQTTLPILELHCYVSIVVWLFELGLGLSLLPPTGDVAATVAVLGQCGSFAIAG